MRKIGLQEMQKIELQILIAFDRKCRSENLHYSLGGGSLIGAIRHKGFIPWDDDIDIFMNRNEYQKFIECAKERNNFLGERYKILIPGMKGYYYPFIKIIDNQTVVYQKNLRNTFDNGVWIDIFPIDYCSDFEQEANAYVITQVELVKRYYMYIMKYPNSSIVNILKNIYISGYRILRRDVMKTLFLRENQLSKNTMKNYAGTLCWALSDKDVYPSDYFIEYIDTLFEGYSVMIFKEYDKILTHRFGNYMQLPELKDRVTHSPDAYIKS